MNDYLNYFDEYVCKGLMPIAVYRMTKQPVGKGWNKNWAASHWRKFFLEEKYELGLLWNNNMIDVETDNEESNEFLNRLIGDIDRPIFKSNRSYHNIFLTPHDKLKKANLFGKNGEKIEIFGKKTFTMAPPSRHSENKVNYYFLNDIWPPPPCPNGIKALYFQQKKVIIKNKEKTITICGDCGLESCVHKSRLSLEVKIFLKHNLSWKCVRCRKKYNLDIKNERRSLRKLLNEV
jgi:hypothetical protein